MSILSHFLTPPGAATGILQVAFEKIYKRINSGNQP